MENIDEQMFLGCPITGDKVKHFFEYENKKFGVCSKKCIKSLKENLDSRAMYHPGLSDEFITKHNLISLDTKENFTNFTNVSNMINLKYLLLMIVVCVVLYYIINKTRKN